MLKKTLHKLNILTALFVCTSLFQTSWALNLAPTSSLNTFLESNHDKIFVNISSQTLFHLDAFNRIHSQYKISSGKTGTGETPQSGQTPRGLFTIQEKYGDGQEALQTFNARQPSGLYNYQKPDKKGIVARIMTLDGAELHNKNTKSRYVYIHGTPFTQKLGAKPASQGCIRMDPYDIINLYPKIKSQTFVYVYDKQNPLPQQQSVYIQSQFIGTSPSYNTALATRKKDTTNT